MKKTLVNVLIFIFVSSFSFAQTVEGTWKLAPEAGALGVGPGTGDYGWWSNGEADVTTRACLFDDHYVFNADGSFQNIVGESTWLEPWQGVDPEGCGVPIAPHNGSNAATWSKDVAAGTITVVGEGAFVGLAKVTNTAEDGKPVDNTITYNYKLSADGSRMDVTINGFQGAGSTAEWIFKLVKVSTTPLEGSWSLAPEAGALWVGDGATQWWASSADDVTTRASLFDDEYIFDEGEMSINDDGDEIWTGEYTIITDGSTWIEPWQGVDEEQCGTPVAPHDESNAPFTYIVNADEETVTLYGVGAYFGLAKVYNDGELTSAADVPDQITYTYVGDNEGVEEEDHHATFHIQVPNSAGENGFATWQFVLENEEWLDDDFDDDGTDLPDVGHGGFDDEGGPMVGVWQLAPIPAALAVGPNVNDLSWYSNSAADVLTRDCLFDDTYIFNPGEMSMNEDGEEIWTGFYEILHDGATWLEPWQGVDEEQCGDPVAPHDASNAPFSYEINVDAQTVTLNGTGAYFGLAKVTNTGQLGAELDASNVPESITYTYIGDEEEEEDGIATFMVDYSPDGDGVWVFVLEYQGHQTGGGPGDGTGGGNGGN